MVLGLFKQYHVAATLFALRQSELCADDAFGSISYVGEWNILEFGDDFVFPGVYCASLEPKRYRLIRETLCAFGNLFIDAYDGLVG